MVQSSGRTKPLVVYAIAICTSAIAGGFHYTVTHSLLVGVAAFLVAVLLWIIAYRAQRAGHLRRYIRPHPPRRAYRF
jgi:membrane-bound metal-dependent hydrolase YbcI (DUF457 family)